MRMTDEDFERRLKTCAALANKQKTGAYSPQSDAWMALELIETMAILLIESHEAKPSPLSPQEAK